MRSGDAEFTSYFAARSDAMRATAYLLCGDWHRAEDLVQTAFTKLYLAWNRVSRHDVLDGYVRQTLIRVYLDEHRRVRWRRERITEFPERARAAITPVERAPAAEAPEDRLVLLRALAELPPRQRAVLVLRYWEDLSVEETASLLECSTGTVKSQAARGLQLLRDLMQTPSHSLD
jgi:RNA polymerase sigma-70 factor (sigma-E family)